MKRLDDNYIEVDGQTYERIQIDNHVNLELDLSEETIKQLDEMMVAGNYISRGEVIRSILRKFIAEEQS